MTDINYSKTTQVCRKHISLLCLTMPCEICLFAVIVASFEMMPFLHSLLTSDPNSLKVRSSAGGEEAMALLSLNSDASIHTKGNRISAHTSNPSPGIAETGGSLQICNFQVQWEKHSQNKSRACLRKTLDGSDRQHASIYTPACIYMLK